MLVVSKNTVRQDIEDKKQGVVAPKSLKPDPIRPMDQPADAHLLAADVAAVPAPITTRSYDFIPVSPAGSGLYRQPILSRMRSAAPLLRGRVFPEGPDNGTIVR